MLSHSEISARFIALDRHPVLMATGFDGWLAWPIVKERLWLLCLKRGAGSRSAASKRHAAARLGLGLRQAVRGLVVPRRATRALLYVPRQVTLPDGRQVHPQLGDVGRFEWEGACLLYRYAWGGSRLTPARQFELDDWGIGALTAAAAWVARSAPSVGHTTRVLADAVIAALPEVPPAAIVAAIRDQLGRFRTRFALMRLLFRRWRIRSVVVLDPDGKVPEVAAAKALGLPVTEVQHGMFSTREPDYSWTAAHRSLDWPLPLPDRVIVFGPLWSRQLRQAGYWRDAEIVEAVNPVLGPFRALRDGRPQWPGGRPLRLLFATQPYVREAALRLWRDVLVAEARRQAEGRPVRFHLRIKVHPLERLHVAEYAALAEAHPDLCSVVGPASDAFDEMLQADAVAGYTSLMLLEAIGMGIPVIALRDSNTGGGFCDVFGLPDLAGLMPSCADSEELTRLLAELYTPAGYACHRGIAQAGANRIYCVNGSTVEQVIADG